jgi:hypothetical protein
MKLASFVNFLTGALAGITLEDRRCASHSVKVNEFALIAALTIGSDAFRDL